MSSAAEGTSVGRKAARGLRWSLLGTMATKVGSFAMALVLARLLTPTDFGIYAIALAATTFVMHINDLGVITATIQWRGRLAEMAPTATVVAAVFSTIVYGVFWVLAPAVSELAGDPSATPVVRLLTATILIDGLAAVRSGALMRRFQQDKLAIATAAGFVTNAVLAISLAASGAGAYSFAGGQVTGSLVTAVLVVTFARVPLRLGLDRQVIARLLRFGAPLAVSLGVEAVLLNADYTIVGKLMGTAQLGFYLMAFNISSWAPGVISTALRYVSVAGFARLAESEGGLARGVQRSVPLLVTAIVPIAALLAVLAVPLVGGLYGDEWLPAAPVLRALAILMVVRMLVAFGMEILMGAGATRSALWINVAWCVALIPALLYGTRLGGIVGAAIAHAVVGLLVAIPITSLALRRQGVRLLPLARAIVRPLAAGAVGGAIAFVVARLAGPIPLVQLAVAGAVGGAIYLVLAVPVSQLREWRALAGGRRANPPAPVAVAVEGSNTLD